MSDGLNPKDMDLDAARLAVEELKRCAIRLSDENQRLRFSLDGKEKQLQHLREVAHDAYKGWKTGCGSMHALLDEITPF